MSQVLLPWCAGSPLQQELVVRPYWYCHGSVSSWSTRTGPLSRTAGDWHLVLQECLPHTARGFRWCKVSLGALVMAQSLIPPRHGPSPSSLLLAHAIFPLLCGRRPSSWLSPSAHVLAMVVKGLAAEKIHAQEQPERNTSSVPQTHR